MAGPFFQIRWILLATLGGAIATSAIAQPGAHTHSSLPSTVPIAIRQRPIAIRSGIGTVHEKISTRSTDAQRFYDQGLAFLHSYSWIDAERSFRQALTFDPTLPMAYVGLSYTGWELQGEQDAREALERARAVQFDAPAAERRRIRMRELQLDAATKPADSTKRAAYIQSLDAALSTDRDDIELLLLRGMAEDEDPAGRGMGAGAGALPLFERAIALSPTHPGPHHYLTHAYENTGAIDKALAHGTTYARLAPQIAHAHHMYAHNLRRVGRIDEAIAEFRAAYDLETSPSRVREVPLEYDWHHPHNLDLLAASYYYLGQMKAAEPSFRQSFDARTPFAIQAFNKREWPAFLLARGRASEALDAAHALSAMAAPLVQAIGHVMEGRALLALGRFAEAAAASNTAMKDLDRAGAQASLAAADLKMLQAEFFLRTDQRARARPLFEDAVARFRRRAGPDAWSQALFAIEAMARSAIDAGDWPLAAYLAEEMRSHDAVYGGTHVVLALVSRAKQDRISERDELEAALKAWEKADADMPELRQIKERRDELAKGGG